MKKLINRPDRVVDEMLDGLLALNPQLSRLAGHNVLIRSDSAAIKDTQVALISGGGSGHEPAHAGYVGPGMLTAAVAGEVFTSPPVDSVAAAIRAVTGRAGCLLVVKNYTGDRLNFGSAAEIAKLEGLDVETVIVADDIALSGIPEQSHAGARGLAGTVLVHKIAGAAAAEGGSLTEVASVARRAAKNLATMGVSLSAGISPGVGSPSFELAANEIELGLGIHGEPGARRAALRPADELTDELLASIAGVRELRPGEGIALLINNLGATTAMELAIIARRAFAYLQARNIVIERMYAGSFMTSLEMAGISLTILQLDEELVRLLDAPTQAPGWPRAPCMAPGFPSARIVQSEQPRMARGGGAQADSRMIAAIGAVCDALTAAEPRLTALDSAVGDGDLGVNMARAARSIQGTLPALPGDIPSALKQFGMAVQNALGGSSGPLYGVLLLRAASVLERSGGLDLKAWAEALLAGCQAVQDLGGAALGDRTMLDALLPFANTLHGEAAAGSTPETALRHAIEAANAGAQRTASMFPRRGRSSYLGERALGVPDPGAVAVTVWLEALAGITSATGGRAQAGGLPH